jgi:hypothetical protein
VGAVDETLDTVIYSNHLVFDLGLAVSQFLGLPVVLSSPLFFFDFLFGCGICLGMVVMLVEEHQRTEQTLRECDERNHAIAASNEALEAEIPERWLHLSPNGPGARNDLQGIPAAR